MAHYDQLKILNAIRKFTNSAIWNKYQIGNLKPSSLIIIPLYLQECLAQQKNGNRIYQRCKCKQIILMSKHHNIWWCAKSILAKENYIYLRGIEVKLERNSFPTVHYGSAHGSSITHLTHNSTRTKMKQIYLWNNCLKESKESPITLLLGHPGIIELPILVPFLCCRASFDF